jgi:hypothetical protein
MPDMGDIAQLQKSAQALQPIVLPANGVFAISFGGLFSALILLGTLAVPFNPFLVLGAIAFFIALFCLLVVVLRPGATYLAVDADGITRCLFFQKKTVHWSDVTNIRAGWLGYETFQMSWNRQVFVTNRLGAKEDALTFFPHQFGLNAKQAVSLLTPYFEHARIERPAAPATAAAA